MAELQNHDWICHIIGHSPWRQRRDRGGRGECAARQSGDVGNSIPRHHVSDKKALRESDESPEPSGRGRHDFDRPAILLPVSLRRAELARNVKRLRKSRGWTQVQLADKLEVEQTAVSRIENCRANPTLETLEAIAVCFGVRFIELFSGNEVANRRSRLTRSGSLIRTGPGRGLLCRRSPRRR
ncbi:helix-turn-helix transcriptional regulator [Bradyrhizobium sp. USDA 3315]